MASSLVVAASTFRPPQNPLLIYEIEVRHRASIPDNFKHWQVFEDDEQGKRFIEVVGEFSHSIIEQQQEATLWKDIMVGQKILQLKENTIPRGLVPLERIFNKDDIASKQTTPEKEETVEYCNIGLEEEPRMIKLSKEIPLQYK